tara:strand:+ start:999 stop:1265 length:267 start_codon:yes stop_codon:yes gene_type:complete
MSEKRIEMISAKLSIFNPKNINIIDEGHLHVGHAGAKKGGHFKVIIVSEQFEGKTLLERHRLVYKAMGDLMETEIHALSISAKTPEED